MYMCTILCTRHLCCCIYGTTFWGLTTPPSGQGFSWWVFIYEQCFYCCPGTPFLTSLTVDAIASHDHLPQLHHHCWSWSMSTDANLCGPPRRRNMERLIIFSQCMQRQGTFNSDKWCWKLEVKPVTPHLWSMSWFKDLFFIQWANGDHCNACRVRLPSRKTGSMLLMKALENVLFLTTSRLIRLVSLLTCVGWK